MSSPELIVFDLDFTLWDCGGTWCDCLTPPFRLERGRVFDRDGRHIRLYEDVMLVLDWTARSDVPTALASRTEQPAWARELVDLLGIADRFAFAEIYPSSKLKHFRALHAASGVAHENMLFFDDEHRNIREVSELGVTCVSVDTGMTLQLFETGLRRYRQ